ncbi:MAG: hypothetical protein DME56_13615 [Verrucomicrobia bacterium]|nr:MAG: hypothetical protein DME56_13615 [Verrucomicrobiota bacterium]
MLKIRPARTDDSDFLAWVIFTAARGHLKRGWFDVVLQRDEAFCIDYCGKLASAAVRSWWHWSLFSVAEVYGRPQRPCVALPMNLYTAHLRLRWRNPRKRWA